MSGDDVVILVNDARVYEAKFPKAGAQLLDLLLAVGASVAGIRDQLSMLTFSKRSVVFIVSPFCPTAGLP